MTPHRLPRLLPALASAALLALAPMAASAQEAAIYSSMDAVHPVWAKQAMVSVQEKVAAEVGLQVLKDGGNAVDAGVAVALALAVTLPRAGNLGGGGFMMVHDAKSGETRAIDYREMAPASATRDMYLDADGNADSNLSRFHGLAVGVPGTVAGLAMIGVLLAALQNAFGKNLGNQTGAFVALAVSLSNISLLGISAPFWALVAGVIVSAVIETSSLQPSPKPSAGRAG